jgi:hypothetical protein
MPHISNNNQVSFLHNFIAVLVVAVYLSTMQFGNQPNSKDAAYKPEFKSKLGEYPDSATASPHLFEKVAIPEFVLARSRF